MPDDGSIVNILFPMNDKQVFENYNLDGFREAVLAAVWQNLFLEMTKGDTGEDYGIELTLLGRSIIDGDGVCMTCPLRRDCGENVLNRTKDLYGTRNETNN